MVEGSDCLLKAGSDRFLIVRVHARATLPVLLGHPASKHADQVEISQNLLTCRHRRRLLELSL